MWPWEPSYMQIDAEGDATFTLVGDVYANMLMDSLKV